MDDPARARTEKIRHAVTGAGYHHRLSSAIHRVCGDSGRRQPMITLVGLLGRRPQPAEAIARFVHGSLGQHECAEQARMLHEIAAVLDGMQSTASPQLLDAMRRYATEMDRLTGETGNDSSGG